MNHFHFICVPKCTKFRATEKRKTCDAIENITHNVLEIFSVILLNVNTICTIFMESMLLYM